MQDAEVSIDIKNYAQVPAPQLILSRNKNIFSTIPTVSLIRMRK